MTLPSERADAFHVLRLFLSAAIIGKNVRIVKVKSGKKRKKQPESGESEKSRPLLCGEQGNGSRMPDQAMISERVTFPVRPLGQEGT